MKLTDYLKDRLTAYFIYGISLVLMLIFMAAFRISFQAIVIVSLILWLAVIVSELWGYFRKKSYMISSYTAWTSLTRNICSSK